MKRYREFQPTGFDPKGLGLDDRQEWLVVPVMRTRDSGPLDESNFDAAAKRLGGEGDTVEVHRFGHWGPGWFEIIIVDPTSEAATVAQEIEACLADYPVLDENDFSEREWNAANETWRHCYNLKERIKLCAAAGVSIFAARRDTIPAGDNGRIFERCRAD